MATRVPDGAHSGNEDDPFELALDGICAKRNEARRVAGTDPERRQAVARVLLAQTARELQLLQDIAPDSARAARVVEGVMCCVGLDDEHGAPPKLARAALRKAGRALWKPLGGRSAILSADEPLRLAQRIRQHVVDRLERGASSEPWELARAVEAGRMIAGGALRIFPKVSAQPLDAWEKAIKEELAAKPRGTDSDQYLAQRAVEACSKAAGNKRAFDLFRGEEKREQRRPPPI